MRIALVVRTPVLLVRIVTRRGDEHGDFGFVAGKPGGLRSVSGRFVRHQGGL
jgi:hypothetical protein